jgi:hypothetical protein
MKIKTRRRVRDGVRLRQVNFEAPVTLYEAIAARAAQNQRSVSAEICVLLDAVLQMPTTV